VSSGNLFRFGDLLSEQIDVKKYAQSFLIQPFFYLRVRSGLHDQVTEKLKVKQISFEMQEDVIKLENGISLEEVLKINKEVVVQDASSQNVFDFLLHSTLTQQFAKPIKVWDVCAASGGKSILLSDRLGVPIKLTVSDNRSSMLHNLKKRLSEAGIPLYNAFTKDISVSSGLPETEIFSIIICDVPCTGSGTWARTPEQQVYFEEKNIDSFVQKQTAIVQNAVKHLEKGGLLFYITCSVFKKENEGVCEMIRQKTGLTSLHQNYISGYESGADTMFVSVFTR
jgi:16S rRNA (cytosine967-C5)-methyltransferase